MGEMRVLDKKLGDLKLIWNPDNNDETESVKKQFDDLVKGKRYLAYNVDKGGDKSTQMKEFDPKAGKIIITPPVAGG